MSQFLYFTWLDNVYSLFPYSLREESKWAAIITNIFLCCVCKNQRHVVWGPFIYFYSVLIFASNMQIIGQLKYCNVVFPIAFLLRPGDQGYSSILWTDTFKNHIVGKFHCWIHQFSFAWNGNVHKTNERCKTHVLTLIYMETTHDLHLHHSVSKENIHLIKSSVSRRKPATRLLKDSSFLQISLFEIILKQTIQIHVHLSSMVLKY